MGERMFHAESNPFCANGLWFCPSPKTRRLARTQRYRSGRLNNVILGNERKRCRDIFVVDKRLGEGIEARLVFGGVGGRGCPLAGSGFGGGLTGMEVGGVRYGGCKGWNVEKEEREELREMHFESLSGFLWGGDAGAKVGEVMQEKVAGTDG